MRPYFYGALRLGDMIMKKTTVRDLTSGSPMRLILGFMLPLLFGMLLQQLYSMIDTIIVGRYLGMEALAGVGSTGSINFLVIGFVQGLCTGFAIPIAQRFGAKDNKALRKFIGNTVWTAAVFALLLTAATCLMCTNILTWMKTPADVFDKERDYIFVIFLGIPATVLYNILSGFIRSVGDSKTPLIFLVISSLLNIALDIFMIVVLQMSVAGAAWATVISQLISGALCLIYIAKRINILHIRRKDLKLDFYYVKRLCAIGLPMGLQYSITAIGSIMLQTAVNSLGKTCMAAMTAGIRVSVFLTCPFEAMGSTMATWGGQNIGANKIERIRSGVFNCMILGIVWAAVALGISLLFGRGLVMLFVDKNNVPSPEQMEEVVSLGRQFLITNASFYVGLAVVNIVRFLIQGMGFSQLALFAGVFEMIARGFVGLQTVPKIGFTGACFASPAAWILADLFLIPAFFACYYHVKKRLTAERADDPKV